ncbi:predicted protein [Plenodomus lingam JN3]|uniref:Predicted protein n=1 Tax=Leptosphaeria maculans (strain JN3 / isolate v23.1.3 / race Av1-4-5-6-7-8) TaxID=985895 RepID=E4ZJZ7_LEPMJ|nr:predicted protein [Plenodomus lingam JN3]CBX91432.1 predicted protein [Plenodomus lingam JN3]
MVLSDFRWPSVPDRRELNCRYASMRGVLLLMCLTRSLTRSIQLIWARVFPAISSHAWINHARDLAGFQACGEPALSSKWLRWPVLYESSSKRAKRMRCLGHLAFVFWTGGPGGHANATKFSGWKSVFPLTEWIIKGRRPIPCGCKLAMFSRPLQHLIPRRSVAGQTSSFD